MNATERESTDDPTGTAGVVFDVDGTLLDTNYLHVIAWSAAFCDNGFPVEMAAIHRAIGLASGGLGPAELQRAGAAEVYDGAGALLEQFGDSLLGAQPPAGRD